MLRYFAVIVLSASSVNVRQNMCLVPNFGIQGNEAGIHSKPANKLISVRVALAGTVTLNFHLH